ncbi:unnamed protein product [Arctogadus glacialis]
MAVKYSDLELALNTLVNGFFSETKDGRSTLDTAEFKTLVSNQLPTLAKTVGEEGGLQTILRQMGVEEGQDITFENFWALVQKQASDQVTAAPDKKIIPSTLRTFKERIGHSSFKRPTPRARTRNPQGGRPTAVERGLGDRDQSLGTAELNNRALSRSPSFIAAISSSRWGETGSERFNGPGLYLELAH